MDVLDLTLTTLLLLFVAALIAGFLDTLVGGGGLITIPALLIAGVPPIYALGTNKLQAVFGSGTASIMMFKLGQVELQRVWRLMLSAFLGSVVGTVIVQYFDASVLQIVIPVVIVIISVYFVLAPIQAVLGGEEKITEPTYRSTAVPAIGFYDGMFGPATGSFFVLAGVSLRGQGIVSATATAKTLNFATNLASLLVFIAYGTLIWQIGAAMILGQIIGARIGAHTLLRIDPRLLRYLVILMCMVMLGSWYSSSSS